MLVYITQGKKTALFRDTLRGLPVYHLTVGRGALSAWRAARYIKALRRRGVCWGIFADDRAAELAEKWGMAAVEVLGLRLAVAGQLLRALWRGEGDTVLLRCGSGGEAAARQCVGELTRLARYVRLDRSDPAGLRGVLMRRWGVAEGAGAAALTVCTGQVTGETEERTLYLTADCHRRQTVTYRLREETEAIPEQLLAALYGAGRVDAAEIHVLSVHPRLTDGGKITIIQHDIPCFPQENELIERDVRHG